MDQYFDLPGDTVEFLGSGRLLEYDPSGCKPGMVRLKSLESLALAVIWIGTDLEGDPHAGEDGCYEIPAVSLTAESESYDPEFLLLWLPREEVFGSWDSDHGLLTVFPDATWGDIVDNPVQYLNAQWDPEFEGGAFLTPWQEYDFRRGDGP